MSDQENITNNEAELSSEENLAAKDETENSEPVEKDQESFREPEEEDVPLSPAQRAKMAKIIAAQKRQFERELEAKYSQQFSRQPAPQDDSLIYDAETGEYVERNSTIGQLLVRDEKRKAMQSQQQQMRQREAYQMEVEALEERLKEGHLKYKNFDAALENFASNASVATQEALVGLDDPAAVIAFFADKKGELHRIAQLKDMKQVLEIGRIEDRLKPKKKLVSQASPPIQNVNENRNMAVDPESQSLDQRRAYWKNRQPQKQFR